MLVIIEVEETDCDNNNDRQDEKSDVVESGVMIKHVVIVVLFDEQIVILLNDQVFVMN